MTLTDHDNRPDDQVADAILRERAETAESLLRQLAAAADDGHLSVVGLDSHSGRPLAAWLADYSS